MSEAYDWNPMPHKVDVICPVCSSRAVFEFAEIVRIKQKKDIDYFKKSKIFEYDQFIDSCGHKWHGAIFYHGLHNLKNVHDLPDGYLVDDFSHSRYWYRFHQLEIGSKVCTQCNLRQKASLRWPQDAFYQCDFKGYDLWAFNRESLIDLREYIASDDRETKDYKYSSFLLHIPSVFLDRKNRQAVVKKLDRLL